MTSAIDLGINGLSRYELIGSGGFASVYAAYEEGVGRTVAVKVLGAVDEAGRRRFERERRTMGATTGHPNIVSLFHSGYTVPDQRPYLVMEHLSGGSLQDHLDTRGPMERSRAIAVVANVADALAFSHRAGIVHKDVKPANILWSPNGVVKLTDFGIAAVREATVTSQVAYSLLYTPPETFAAHRDPVSGSVVDPRNERSDLYSLAATLFALVTGGPPFQSPTQAGLMSMIVNEPPPPCGHPDLDRFFAVAMAKNPAHRPATGDAFVEMLRAPGPRAQSGPITVVAPPSSDQIEPPPPPWRAPRPGAGLVRPRPRPTPPARSGGPQRHFSVGGSIIIGVIGFTVVALAGLPAAALLIAVAVAVVGGFAAGMAGDASSGGGRYGGIPFHELRMRRRSQKRDHFRHQ